MIENIRSEFKIMLTEYDWMDTESKKAALEKAESIVLKIGYPDFTYDDYYLNKMYFEVIGVGFFDSISLINIHFLPGLKYNFDENEYFENAIRIDRIVVMNNIKELRKEIDRKQ
jgi:predicted metalloendopeptidase